jgi:hypothetical protein
MCDHYNRCTVIPNFAAMTDLVKIRPQRERSQLGLNEPEARNQTHNAGLEAERLTGVCAVGKIKDKVVGKTKQAVAKVTGDDSLAEEGKRQDRKADNEPFTKPFGNLDKLT